MTLPSRKKQAAPLPPQRDPRTSLSYSKGNSKSMAEGLAEIEKLDAAIAEFEGQETIRRHSLHGLLDNAGGDPKVASVRASHSAKRVSVVDYDELLSGEAAGQVQGQAAGINARPAREYISPAEARIKKYHKKTPPPIMERTRSTPNLAAPMDDQLIISSNGHLPYKTNAIITGNGPGGSLNKTKAPMYHQRSASGNSTPELPDRHPVNGGRSGAPGGPPTPEVVRINTGAVKKSAANGSISSSSSNGIYANVSGLVGQGSSFRPPPNSAGSTSSRQQENSGPLPPPPEHTILKTTSSAQNRRQQLPMDSIIVEGGGSGSKGISFADQRVMEHAQQFIKKHPTATLLVTADIHASPEHGQDKALKEDDVFEPEPDYEDSGDEEKQAVSVGKQMVTSPLTSQGRRESTPSVNSSTSSTSVVRQNRGSVTVISISSNKSKSTQNTPTAAAVPSITAGNHSPAQSSMALNTRVSPGNSLASSRRSSAQSGVSGAEDAPARETSFFTSAQAPPAPPPPPPPGPPPPPDYSPGGTLTLKGRKEARAENPSPKPALPSQVSQEDILAAVANRKSRIETVGPKVSDVKASPIAKSTHELNQEALLAAVARRKSRMESEDKSLVDDIEAKLNRNKKLQAAKFNRSTSKVETSSTSSASSTTPAREPPSTKNNSSKAPAPPPPAKSSPPPAVQPKISNKEAPSTNTTTKPAGLSQGSSVQAKQGNGSSPSSPAGSAADYIALAERARLEYLKKKASGNMVATVSKKGPVEITPMGKKNSALSKDNQKPKTNGTTPVNKANGKSPVNPKEVKPESAKSEQNGNVPVKGVTVDHSHTEQTVNGGRPNSPPPGLVPLPPVGFQDVGDAASPPSVPRGVVIDILPPPSSFDVGLPSPPPPQSAGRQEDAASLVSSVSSLSTLSSEHGNSSGMKPGVSIEDMIAPPPPPPPAFDDMMVLNDQDMSFILPPPQFLEIDANANESKSLDKNSRPFANKSVGAWSCLDVLDWLDSLGLPQYRTSFAKAHVDGSKLLDMGRTEFIALGVTQVGHRMNLERSVKKLNIAASTNL
ncbi:hypothetical protein EGW08_010001 [Elysia chlorotica]|uniref:SAM domain-containing protein n=1 Tax=Elysia chlorotica TaxID=188477 RepID=A0A433TL22_ELYCH|nr:hypothetical protein EGW08_010001 [Elysia chlorotica]